MKPVMRLVILHSELFESREFLILERRLVFFVWRVNFENLKAKISFEGFE